MSVHCPRCGEYVPGHATGASDICVCGEPNYIVEVIGTYGGYTKFTIEGAARTILEARKLIEKIGTTGVERPDIIQAAEAWMNKYFPNS